SRIATAAALALLAGPAALAFFSGGYFDQPRLVAAIAAWVLVALVAVLAPQPLPRGWPARLALAGLVALTAVTGLAITWARLAAGAVGLLARAWAAPTRAQLRAIAISVGTAIPVIVATVPLDGVRAYAGSPAGREGQGAVMLVVLAAAMAVAFLLGPRERANV